VSEFGLSLRQAALKRGFDFCVAIVGVSATGWLILVAWLAASIDTRSNGLFIQKRVGRRGRIFRVLKIRTMRPVQGVETVVTTDQDPRITPLGRFWRKTKIDELPQLINVLKGDMSFVGPRPDVPGFADRSVGEERLLLSIRPGITGPATLKYRNEEQILMEVDDPEKYNREVIFPDKVRINLKYIREYSFWKDLKYIWKTVFG
jgi:lipopolysaccharide/colanic/teichoic acid biosynthesis glycosyltransferase